MNQWVHRVVGAALVLAAVANFALGLAGQSPLQAWLCIQRPDVSDPCSGLYPLAEIAVLVGFFVGVYLLLTGAGNWLEP
jgi:hypothetical protein